MKAADAYAELRRWDGPVITTREAAALWRTEEGTARRRLRSLADAELVIALRRGLWGLDTQLDPFALAPYLTAPLPAYVSTFSALAVHGLIEQIPRRVSVASLDRARRVGTAIASYEIHHLAPAVFGGYAPCPSGASLATQEKALFDLVYLRAASGNRAYTPELTLPASFSPDQAGAWCQRIAHPRLRTIVGRRLHELVANAARER